MKTNAYAFNQFLTLRAVMKMSFKLLSVVLLCIMADTSFAQGVITHTTSGDFNKGNLNNVSAINDYVNLPFQSDGLNMVWTSTGNMPDKRSNHKISYANNRIYLTGGDQMIGYSAGQEVLAYCPSVYMADVSGGAIGTWTMLDSLPYGVRDHAALVMNGFLYVIGGISDSIPTDSIFYTKILFNGTLDEWKPCTAKLPQPRWGMTAEYLNGYLVIAGGSTSADDFTASNSVYTALIEPDGDIHTFVAQPSLPEARNQHTMVRYGNTLYVMGGYDNLALVKNTVWYTSVGFDGTCSAWLSAGTFPVAVFGHTSTCYNGLLTMMGGYTDTIGNAISQCFYAKIDNAPALSWLSDNYYPQHLAFADAFAINSKVFCLGGYDVFENTKQDCYYDAVIMSTTRKVKTGIYLSPLLNLATNLQFTELSYNGINLSDYTVYWRSAENGGTWGAWVNAAQANPIPLSVIHRYFQYMFVFENAPESNQIYLHDVSVKFNASAFAGYMSGNLHWTLAASPYLCTADAFYSAGTLTIDAGVTVLFMNETGLQISQGSVICNGSSDLPVTFTSFSGEQGSWEGLYFEQSSNAYPSTFNYAIIEMAGYGTRQANLYCNYTLQPAMNHCTLRQSTGNGAYIEYSHLSVNYTSFENNINHGLYLKSSSPTLSNTSFDNNDGYGLAIQDNSFPQMTNISITNNLVDEIIVLGGTIWSSGTWVDAEYAYVIWDNVIVRGGVSCRLTIAAGNMIKARPGKSLSVGYPDGGGIYAIGRPDSIITFTSYNNAIGGWEGLVFGHNSGSPNSSFLKHCIVEKGNQYNLYTEFDQPLIDSCLFRLSAGDGLLTSGNIPVYNSIFENNAGDGIQVQSGSPDFDNVLVQNNGGHGFHVSYAIHTGIINSSIKNNTGHGFCMHANNSPEFFNVSFNGNQTNNEIIVLGSNIGQSVLWRYEGMDYIIWDNVIVNGGVSCRLTIAAGNVIKARPGKSLSVGYANAGGIYAVGRTDSIITFTSYNNAIGGWEGLVFGHNSGSPNSSFLKHCIVEKGNQYNLYTQYDQPLIDSCLFRLSAGDGIQASGNVAVYNSIIENNAGDGIEVTYGSPDFDNVLVQNNGGHGVHVSGGVHTGIVNSVVQNNVGHGFCMNPGNSPEFYNVSFIGNQTNNEIIVLGGNIYANTLWRYEAMNYIVWDNVYILNHSRLTIAAGDTIRINPAKSITLGYYNHSGELYAIGKSDSIILFTSHNNSIGGWNGLVFGQNTGSPNSSKLKYCVIEKGNQYNLYSQTNQPEVDSCIFWNSANYGIHLNSSAMQMKNSQVIYNGSYGVYIDGTSTPIIGNTDTTGCDLYGNGTYDVYNNTANDIPAAYNFWGSTDMEFIQSRIYDKNDNPAKGYVLAGNPALSGLQILSLYDIHGRVTYDNNVTTGMKNSFVNIKNLAGEILSGTATNLNGYYFNGSLNNGTYVTDGNTTAAWGGVNATDALKIMRHYAMLETLTGVRKAAADVNASGAINSADAMQVLQRYTQTITSFASGDWYFEKDTITIAGASVENNIKGICFGDVNGSYVPYSAKGNSIGLVYEGSVFAGSYEQIEVPVRVKMPLHAGAISLGFNFPEEFMQIESVTLGNGSTNIVHSSENGLFRLAWSQIEPFVLNKDEIILNLNISTKDLSGMIAPIKLLLYEESEIADENAQVFQDIVLSIPVIEYLLTGLPESELSSMSIYPNPVRGNAIVSLNLSCSGMAKIEVFDVFGNQIKSVTQNIENRDNNSILVNLSELKTGVYFIKLKISCNGQEYVFNKKIIVQN